MLPEVQMDGGSNVICVCVGGGTGPLVVLVR